MDEKTIEPSYLRTLNAAQKEAVLYTEGPLLILAGAGAGKTKTVTHRILHLIRQGVRPSQILAITFTNKAAGEMRERVGTLLKSDATANAVPPDESPMLSTFHSLGVHIIKDNAAHLGLTRYFSIFDRGESKQAIKDAMKSVGVDPKTFEPGKVLGFISRLKGDGMTVDAATSKSYFEETALSVWNEYEKILAREKALDFDDLLLKTLLLLRKEDIRKKYQEKWKYIHIDEYQDTNKVQYDIAKILAGDSHNIAVVGDIDQSIYSWRGADFKNIMRFEKDYPETKTVLLEQNYRSTKTILEAANTVIAKNVMRKDKRLFTENCDGDKISLYIAMDERDEASYIARTADMLSNQGVPCENIAVLYRANFQSRSIEEAMIRRGIPYSVIGTKFFDRKEVKDVVAYIRAALNPDSLTDLKRIINTPARGIGKVTMLKIFEGKEATLGGEVKAKVEKFRSFLHSIAEKSKRLPPSEVVKFVIVESGLETSYHADTEEGAEKIENMRELASIATPFDLMQPGEGMEKFLEHIALSSDQDELKDEKKGVRLMTVHAAKGLEFDYVFITGLEAGLFPHERMSEMQSAESSEEERRLFYVALTRAGKKLYLSYAQMRMIFGSTQIAAPSEFVADIDDCLLQYENSGGAPSDKGGTKWNFFADF